MFAPHCPRCQTRVLLGTRRIVAAEVTPAGGRAVVLRCWCGERVLDDLGGATSRAPAPSRPGARVVAPTVEASGPDQVPPGQSPASARAATG